MAVVFAFRLGGERSSDAYSVFEGNKARYRTVRGANAVTYYESILDCLPQDALLTTRKNVASVGSGHSQSLDIFNKTVGPSNKVTLVHTAPGRKVLLTCDAHCSRMGIVVLAFLHAGGVIGYALPAELRNV